MQKLLDNAANLFATSCMNHVFTNLPKKLKHWLQYKLQADIGNLKDVKEWHLKNLSERILEHLENGERFCSDYTTAATQLPKAVVNAIKMKKVFRNFTSLC